MSDTVIDLVSARIDRGKLIPPYIRRRTHLRRYALLGVRPMTPDFLGSVSELLGFGETASDPDKIAAEIFAFGDVGSGA